MDLPRARPVHNPERDRRMDIALFTHSDECECHDCTVEFAKGQACEAVADAAKHAVYELVRMIAANTEGDVEYAMNVNKMQLQDVVSGDTRVLTLSITTRATEANT